ncbi:MAG: hypothetical protein NC418_08020 [Muribaculaceae bacterium]|nr:hypothetical protein [Muribaculaceae bacterium]
MKTSLRTLVCALVVFITGALSAAALPLDKYTLERDQLPEQAREFLNTYFPKAKVGMIKVDKPCSKRPTTT